MVSGTSIGNHQHQYVYIIISNAILSIWLICIQYIKTIRYTYSYLIDMSKKSDISDFSVSCFSVPKQTKTYMYIYIYTSLFLPQMPLVPTVFQVHDLDSYVTPGPGTYNAHTTSFVYWRGAMNPPKPVGMLWLNSYNLQHLYCKWLEVEIHSAVAPQWATCS